MPGGLIGRRGELALADDLIGRAHEGTGRALLIGGEPGIGKSRLVEEIAASAEARGAIVVWGRCWEAGGAPPYWPWVDALSALARRIGIAAVRDALGQAADDLALVVDDLRSATATRNLDDTDARFRFYEAVVDLLRLTLPATGEPAVLAFDDIHVADPSSLLLLDFVASRLDGCGVLLVATYRDSEVEAGTPIAMTLAELLRRATTRVVLTGLNEGEVSELIESTSGIAARPGVARRVREQTDGNPLYVSEVARLFAAPGRDGGLMPRDVRDTILRRTAPLPDKTRAALSAAAVLGREFPIDVLVAITSADVLDALEPAAASELIAAKPGAIGVLRFSHAVVAQALYDATPATKRMHLHLLAGEALERRHEANLDGVLGNIARHYAAAVPLVTVERARDFAERAGDLAMQQLAFEEAARHYQVALEANASAPDRDARDTDLLLGIGDAYARAGDTDAAKAAFLAAADRARAASDSERLATAALGYGGRFVWQRRGGDDGVVPLLEEALAAVPAGSRLWVRVASRLSGALRDEWDPSRRIEIASAALDAAERIGDSDLLVMATMSKFTAIWTPDALPELVEMAASAARIAPASSDPEQAREALMLNYFVRVAVNNLREARAEIEEYAEQAARSRQPSRQWIAGAMGMVLTLAEGPLDGVEETIDDIRRLGRYAQARDAAASHRMDLAQLRLQQGRLTEFEAELRQALDDFPNYPLFRALLVLCLAQRGETREAAQLAAVLAGDGPDSLPFDISWLYSMQALAEAAFEMSDEALGAHLRARLEPYAGLVGQASGEVAMGTVDHHLGMLCHLVGDFDAAEEHYEAALRHHREGGAHAWVGETLQRYASMLERRGTRDDARRAVRMFTEADELIQRLGSRRHSRSSPTAASVLTRREEDVARLVAAGLSNKDIAARLYVSERTAETHVQHILTKLGFTSRAQIAGWAVASGLVST